MIFESMATHTIVRMRQFCNNKEQAADNFPLATYA